MPREAIVSTFNVVIQNLLLSLQVYRTGSISTRIFKREGEALILQQYAHEAL
jgi:hypothetical protein